MKLVPHNTDGRAEIEDHIASVQALLERFVSLVADRADNHDRSKLEEPELSIFAGNPRSASSAEYGSPAYEARLQQMAPAVKHHYEVNRHHPQHFANGVNGMTLIDLVEMFFDQASASIEYDGGDLTKAIEINKARFGFSDQLESIFKNTAAAMFGAEVVAMNPQSDGDSAA